MSSSSESPSTGPRVRPVTWVILGWVVIMIAAIVGAWQGSTARFGALPEITVASDRGSVDVLPFSASDLDGNTYTNPVGEFTVTGEHTLTVRLPVELQRATMDVYEVREGGSTDYTVQPDEKNQLLIPVTTEEGGRLEGLAIRSVPLVYNAEGEETVLNGEWSVGVTYED